MDYNDKLKLAKEALDSGSYDKETIEYIFPELKESEDERNIKNLIDELKSSLRAANCQNYACGGGHEKRIALLEWGIAWLEKQNEQVNFINKIQIGDRVTRNEDGMLVNLSQLKRVAKKDEKQGEQKPAEVRTTGYWNVQDIEQKPTEWIQELESKLSNATPEQLAEWKRSISK